MLPRERVFEALNHRKPDRVPLYLWIFKQPGVTQAIEAKYGSPAKVRDEVRRVMRELKPGGGFIFCTSHMVQPGTPLEEVEMAYQTALEESRY